MFARNIKVDHDVYVARAERVVRDPDAPTRISAEWLDQRAREIIDEWFAHIISVSYP